LPKLCLLLQKINEWSDEVMVHIESHRLFELAHLPGILDLPEWEHISICSDCSIALIRLIDVIERCSSRLTEDPITVCS